MGHDNWQYDVPQDLDRSMVERLRGFPREPDMLVYGLRTLTALAIRGWLRLYHRLEIVGRNNLPTEGSYVLVANHASHLDALTILAALPLARLHRVFPAAAKDFFFVTIPRLTVAAIIPIWSLTLARHDQGATVTAADWPAVLEVAMTTASRFGLADRFHTLPGNFHETVFPDSAFDIAVLGNVTHLESAEGIRSLFVKLRQAIRPRGRIAIFDIFPGQAAGDLNRALYILGLALRTEAGHVYSPQELEGLLAESGFERMELFNLAAPPYAVGMLIGTRVDYGPLSSLPIV